MECFSQRESCVARCTGECRPEGGFRTSFCCSSAQDADVDDDVFGWVIAGCAAFVVVAAVVGLCTCCWCCRRRR